MNNLEKVINYICSFIYWCIHSGICLILFAMLFLFPVGTVIALFLLYQLFMNFPNPTFWEKYHPEKKI